MPDLDTFFREFDKLQKENAMLHEKLERKSVIALEQLTIKRSILRQMRHRFSLTAKEFGSMKVLGYIGHDAIENGSEEQLLIVIEGQLFLMSTSLGYELKLKSDAPQIFAV